MTAMKPIGVDGKPTVNVTPVEGRNDVYRVRHVANPEEKSEVKYQLDYVLDFSRCEKLWLHIIACRPVRIDLQTDFRANRGWNDHEKWGSGETVVDVHQMYVDRADRKRAPTDPMKSIATNFDKLDDAAKADMIKQLQTSMKDVKGSHTLVRPAQK